ncbi:MAG TPA: ATP-binding cassette domain-containing protein [Candidatus Kapabacteria bacterium]|nr:ATP-binding cassette domain-containing protein [Candidatus Kapabacteria bacterium]
MIELQDVTLAYGDRVVLDGVSLRIASNEITSILGPSGSGKSTIIKLMLGLIKPTSGKVFVEGVDISRMKEKHLFPIRRKMGMVFQGNALFDSLTVTENLTFFLKENLQLSTAETAERIREQIAFAGLQGFEHQFPETLSGGMKKRLAISRALIFGPEMVLLDEPTVGLDPVSTKRVLDVILRLKQEKGLGAVLVTHLINDVFGIADKVIVLYEGKIIFNDIPHAMHGFDHPFVESFLSNTLEAA